MDKYVCTLSDKDYKEYIEIFDKINALNNLLLIDEVIENREISKCVMEEFDLYKSILESWWKRKRIEGQWNTQVKGYWWVDYNSKKVFLKYDEEK